MLRGRIGAHPARGRLRRQRADVHHVPPLPQQVRHAARVQRTRAMKFNSIRSRNCSGVVSSTLPRIERPALFTSTSRRPNCVDGLGKQPIDVVLSRNVGMDARARRARRPHFRGGLLARRRLPGRR